VQRSLEPVCAAAAAYFTVSVSVFTAIFQVDLGYPVFIEATDDGSGWCSWNYRSCKLQSSSQIVTTNKPTPCFFTCRMPFLSPNRQCQIKSLKGIISLSINLLTPTSPGVVQLLSLTTNSSWLPWGRVFMPLISPLMPVPHAAYFTIHYIIQHFTVKGA